MMQSALDEIEYLRDLRDLLQSRLKELEGHVSVPPDIFQQMLEFWTQDHNLGTAWYFMDSHPVVVWMKEYAEQQNQSPSVTDDG